MSSRPAKKRKLTPPQSDDEGDSRSNAKIQKAFFKNAAKWDLEDQYHAKNNKKSKKEGKTERLPLKLRDGRVQAVSAPVDAAIESDEDWLDGADDVSVDDDEDESRQEPERPEIPIKQQIREAKEELAKIATMLSSSPDENVGAFKALNKIGESKIPAIITLSLVTRMAIYKDMIPGYRIRPVSEDAPKEKLSKDVKTLRNFETALVSGYQIYVKELAKYAKAGRRSGESDGIASVAITCACTLLTSVPHFNFRGDLIKILVGKLSTKRVDKEFVKCLDAFKKLFDDDDEGRPSFEAVATLGKMMKSKEYDVDESVVNLFLHLRLLSEFSGRASKESVDLPGVGPNGKKPKFKKQFRTKRLRKELKEQKALEKDMAAADALVSHEERDRMQSETLRAVFGTYFRILKLTTPHLMGAVLEGLAKYSHLINQDFFGDLLEALKDLIRNSELETADETPEGEADGDEEDESTPMRNSTREALLCTVTAFALLAGQDAHNARSDLHLDLSFFTTHLWQTLIPVSMNPDLELGARSLHLPDPDAPPQARKLTSTSGNKVNLQTTTVLLIRCLTAVLLPPWNIRSTPPLRLASFAKQLMSTSLHVPEKSAQAILALLADVSNTHGRKIAALWHTEERKGDGVYNALADSETASNPFATRVWEGELLRRHYCPKIREGVKMLEKSIVNER
ncbi:nucleolar complex-associated protein 3 [Xylariaceae sp. FL0255]|nr:nucleolar complex-associated protein 3 [Xylariaceae sp. FL0255]